MARNSLRRLACPIQSNSLLKTDEIQSCVLGEFGLAFVESEKSRGGNFQGTGDMKDIHRAAAEARRFGAEPAEGVHQVSPADFGKMIESPFPTVLEKFDLLIRLCWSDFFPECLQAQCVDKLCFLDFPDRKWQILGGDACLHRFRSGLPDVEFEQSAGIQIEHVYQRPSRSAAMVSCTERPVAGMAVAR